MVFIHYNSKTNNRDIRPHGDNKVQVNRYINDIELIIYIYIYLYMNKCKVLITGKIQTSNSDRCRGRFPCFMFFVFNNTW